MYTPIVSKLYDNDVLSSAEYIADVLQNPAAANRLVDEAKKKFIEVLENLEGTIHFVSTKTALKYSRGIREYKAFPCVIIF